MYYIVLYYILFILYIVAVYIVIYSIIPEMLAWIAFLVVSAIKHQSSFLLPLLLQSVGTVVTLWKRPTGLI